MPDLAREKSTANGTRFASHYDGVIEQPLLRAFYEQSDFFNTGYWTDRTSGIVEACENLMGRIAEGLPAQTASLLDVGCGLGGSTRWLLSHCDGARVTAVNLSFRQLRTGQNHGIAARFTAMDAARLALMDHAFDAVVSVEAAFHFRTRQQFLQEAWRVLRPGGALALSDILFKDPSLLGPGMVAEENRVQGLDGYAALLQETGFAQVRLQDATRECWDGFCTHLGGWLRRKAKAGEIDEPTLRSYGLLVQRLQTSCVQHYLLAWAVRP